MRHHRPRSQHDTTRTVRVRVRVVVFMRGCCTEATVPGTLVVSVRYSYFVSIVLLVLMYQG